MQCNIQSKGKAVRLISGLIHCGAGLILLVLLAIGWVHHLGVWIAAGALILAGAFQVFEGWAGWCVLRAMGIKTPL